jgi:hypothetical protein
MAYVILPDGSGYPIQEGQSPQEAMSAALRQYPEAFGFAPSKPKEDTSGGIAAASAGLKRLKGEGALTLGKMGLMGLPEAEKYYKEQEAAAAQRFTPTQDDWSTSPWLKFKETLGGSLPYMAAPLAAGFAATTLPVSGALSAAALGALGAGAVSTGQFTGSNLAAQMETGKTLEEADLGKAALTAVPQAALDTAAMFLAPGLGKLLGAAGREVTEAGAKALANQTLKQIAWDYTKATSQAMTAEGLTEAAQQLLERAQAGLDISDPEARKEYLESLQGGAALAFVLGPFGRAVDRGSIKAQGKKLEEKRLGEERAVAEAKQAEERTAAQAAQAEADAAEAERKQQPEYLRELNTQYQALEREKQTLPKIEKPKKVKDASAEQELAYEDALKTYEAAVAAKKDFIERYKPVKQEYKERFNDIQALQVADQTQEALQGGAGPMAQPMLPGFELGAAQPGAAEQLAAEQENQQYFQQPAEVTPAPATLTPTQQRVELMQQRDTLAKAYTEISGRAMKSAVPEEQRALFNQAVQVKTALTEADAQLKNLGGKLPTLEALQKKEVELTNLAEKAKTAPQKQAVLGKLVEVRQQIATFAAPTVEGQGTLAFKPTAQEIAADKTARAERQKQEALEGGAGPMQQTLIPGLTEPVLPTRKFDVEAEAEPTAFDTQEEARKLSIMADRKEALFKKQEAVVADLDDKASTAPFASYAGVRKAADAERKKADEMRQEVDAMRKQVEDLKAQAAVIPEKTEDMQRAGIEKKMMQAQRRFERAQAVGDREMADAEYAKVLKLQEKLAEFPQVNLEQGAAVLQAYETALAEKIAAGREQSVEGQRAANVALAKAKADIQALMGTSETAPLVQEARVGKQQDITQQQRELAQFEAEGPGAVTPKMPAAKQTEDLRQALRDIDRFEDESPSVFTSAADDARAEALLKSITQSRNVMKQRTAAANAATRGLRPLNTAVERAAKAAKTAPVKEKAAPTAAPAPAPKTPQTPVEKREEAKQAAVEKQAAAKKAVEEKRAAAKRAQSEKAKPKAEPKAAPKAETKAEEVAKAETETRRLMEEQPDLFSDDKFDSDTDTDNDVALRENNDLYDAFPTNLINPDGVSAAEDGNLMGLLEAIGESSTPFNRALVKNLQDTLRAVGRRPKLILVENLKDKGVNVAGLYDPVKNRIYIDNRSMHEETVLHEAVHAVTLGVLRADPNTLTAEQRAARSELESLYAKLKDDPAFAREYGKKNVEEFVAELMTNANLREKIDAVKPGFLQRFYQAIMRMLGMEPKSLSEQAMASALKIFQPPSPMAKDSVMLPSIMRGVFSGTKAVAAANVDPGAVATVNALVGRSASLGDKITASAMGLRMRTIAADNWAPSEALIKLGVSKGKLSEAQALQMRLLMRVYDDTSRLAQRSLSDGPPKITRNADGVKVIEGQTDGPSAKKMAQALSGSKLGNAHFVEDLWTSWMAILRAERDGIGYDKLNYGNDKQGNPILNAEKAKAVKAIVESDADTKKAFEDARAIYRQYNKDLLQFFVDSGSMTQEKANALTAGDYVPYYRITKGLVQLYVGSSKPITIGSIIDQPQLKELVGGEDKILPVFSGMVQNTSLIVRSAVRNMQMRDVGNMLQDMGLAKIIQGEGPRDVFTARFSSKGEKYYVRLDETAFPPDIPADVVIMGLQGIKTAIPATVKLMGLPANILRKGITRLPTYAYRQLIRDPIHAYMTTGGDFSAVIDTYREFAKSLKGDTPAGLSLKQAGAISSDIYPGSQEEMANALRDVTSGKNGWNINGVLAKLDALGLKADTATRAALYNNFRKKGMSHLEAVLGAAESMNFSRRGTSASLHWLSTMIPFFNSQIQGLDAVYRAAITGDTAFQAKLDARAKLWKRGALMFGMTFAYAALMQDDEAYKTATPLERAQYWFLRIPGVDEPLRIPIPFEPGLMFKVIPEMIFNTAAGDTKARDAMDAFGKMLAMSQPIGLPAGVKPLIELAANYNFYTDAPIISERESGLTTAQQFRNNTTEIAKILGKTGAISPVSVDHLIRGYTGGLGILLASMANYPLRPLVSPNATDKPARALSEMPAIGSLFQPATGRGIVDAAFKDVEEFRKAAGTYQSLLKSGNRADAAAFADKYAREIALNSTGGAFRQQMGELAALRRQIEMAPGMSSEQKQAQIKRVKEMQIQLATMIRQMSSAP